MACVDCRWFVHEDDETELDKGTCRRRPPTACYDAESGWAFTVWPHVDWTDRCGEFQRRPTVERIRESRTWRRVIRAAKAAPFISARMSHKSCATHTASGQWRTTG